MVTGGKDPKPQPQACALRVHHRKLELRGPYLLDECVPRRET